MKTRAAILFELHKPLVLDDVEIPFLKRGQVLVKILYSGVCRAQYNEMIGLKGPDKFLPHLLGHEASGHVVEVGAGITKVKAGDYVCLSWIKGKGLDGINSQYRLGNRIINAGAVTTFSDYAVVSENRIVKIPSSVSPEVASIVGCAVATGCGIVEHHLPKRGSVAVFGAGGVGLSAILAARRKDCRVVAVDVSDSKLKFARRLGVNFIINAQRTDAVAKIKNVFKEGVDLSIDASGQKKAMEDAFAVIKEQGGLCVIAGNLSKNEKIELHPFEFIKGKRIIGTWGGETFPDKDIPLFLRRYSQGDLPIDKLITHRFDLACINKAFESLIGQGEGRIILKMRE